MFALKCNTYINHVGVLMWVIQFLWYHIMTITIAIINICSWYIFGKSFLFVQTIGHSYDFYNPIIIDEPVVFVHGLLGFGDFPSLTT